MQNHYNWSETQTGYEFLTIQGLNYLVYFTDFYLEEISGEELKTLSLGITCKQGDDFMLSRKDGMIKYTIIKIIEDYFVKNPDEAVLYVCLTDGNQRGRRITFGRWFHELENASFEKHDCDSSYTLHGFYASIIVKTENQAKQKYIDSFHYTLKSWLGLI